MRLKENLKEKQKDRLKKFLKIIFPNLSKKIFKIIMFILGDIGNSDTKLFLVNSNNKIIKKTTFSTKNNN